MTEGAKKTKSPQSAATVFSDNSPSCTASSVEEITHTNNSGENNVRKKCWFTWKCKSEAEVNSPIAMSYGLPDGSLIKGSFDLKRTYNESEQEESKDKVNLLASILVADLILYKLKVKLTFVKKEEYNFPDDLINVITLMSGKVKFRKLFKMVDPYNKVKGGLFEKICNITGIFKNF